MVRGFPVARWVAPRATLFYYGGVPSFVSSQGGAEAVFPDGPSPGPRWCPRRSTRVTGVPCIPLPNTHLILQPGFPAPSINPLSHSRLGSSPAAPPAGPTGSAGSRGETGVGWAPPAPSPRAPGRGHQAPPSRWAQNGLHFPGCKATGPLARRGPRAARRSVACSGARVLARGRERRPGMSCRAVPPGRAGLRRAGSGQGRRAGSGGTASVSAVPRTGARGSPHLSEVPAPSRPGRLACQSLGRRQRRQRGRSSAVRRARAGPSGGNLPQPLNSPDSSPQTCEAAAPRFVGRLRNLRRALSPVTPQPLDLLLGPESSLRRGCCGYRPSTL